MELKHFELEEFACPCCGRVEMDPYFLRLLDMARERAGTPFKITSGYRCERHNREVGGAPNSAHLRGLAADIACPSGGARFVILEALRNVGFIRIGLGSNFIHADAAPWLPQRVIWTYGS